LQPFFDRESKHQPQMDANGRECRKPGLGRFELLTDY